MPVTEPFALRKARDALQRRDMPLAAAAAREAIAQAGTSSEAWFILGTAANALKDFETAERAFEAAARHAPAGTPAKAHMLILRAEPLICLGHPAEAVASVRAAVAPGLSSARDCFLAALALSHAGLPAEALPLAEKAVTLDPRHADAWSIIGNVRQFNGDIAGAEAAYNTVISLSRDHAVAAYHSLAHLKKWSPQSNHTSALEAFKCRSSAEASRVGYALFKEYDDIGDTAAAWECLEHGARVGRAMESWTSDKEAAVFAAWKRHYGPDRLKGRDDRARNGPRRIFIVGLPRSGTTLVERILVSHSRVQAIGEVNSFAIAARRLAAPDAPGIVSPEIIAATTRVDPLEIAEAYTHETAYLSDGSAYTIDKRPDNYEYVGLLRLAFPDALIVGLDRNPMDALFGAYKRVFAKGSHGWSYTLPDLADHYHHFRDLMGHWKRVLGDGFIQVSLETLIDNPDVEIRRLLDACGLPFEDACLSPHTSKGAVTTASAVQVRKPINREGVGAWKRYAPQLEPLRRRLEDMGYLKDYQNL
jgi:tetratricopeptide (TPR) repeat protein